MTKTKTYKSSFMCAREDITDIAVCDVEIFEGHWIKPVQKYDGSFESFLEIFMNNHQKTETRIFYKGEKIDLPEYWDNSINVTVMEHYQYEENEDDVLVF